MRQNFRLPKVAALLTFLSLGALAFACGRDQGMRAPLMGDGSGAGPGDSPSGGGSPSLATGGVHAGGSDAGAPSVTDGLLIQNVRLGDEGGQEIFIRKGVIEQMGADLVVGSDVPRADAEGAFALPAVIDSHVHLTYYPVAETLALAGVLGAVDLAAPIEALQQEPGDIAMLRSGPMVTAIDGYPTQSWGQNGYGLEVADVAAARAAVLTLLSSGAGVIKVPFDGSQVLSDESVLAVVDEAHKAGVFVVAHALSDLAAERAALLGCDVLAHTPTELLREETVELWKERTVISTLRAFGGGNDARENLKQLFAAGTRVLYGTDLGNSRLAAIDTEELELLVEAGMSRKQAFAAATEVPAAFWGMPVGTLQVGKPAHFLLLSGDPAEDLSVLESPLEVYAKGRRLSAGTSP